MIRLLWCLGIALIVPLMAWLAGYNFDERGVGAVVCGGGYLIVALFAAAFSLPYPGEKK